MERTKESAMKAIAKRPKLFPALVKGGDIQSLKKAGEVSGGFIRSLIWCGVAEINDGIVKFKKSIKKSDLPDLDAKPSKKEKKEKPGKKEKVVKEKKNKHAEPDSKPTESKMVKLLKPVGDIPANMKIKAVKKDDFWWVEGKRIATTNLQFVK